jgi:dihydroorotate dehydrogenase
LIYRAFFELVLRRIPPATAHSLAVSAARAAGAIRPLAAAVRWALRPDPSLRVDALGLSFPSPLGVAGGLDKDARWFEQLGMLGFGFVEVGTVTAAPQEGNPGRTVWRLPRERALVNSQGFPNRGAAEVAGRLGRNRTGAAIVAANIGKSRVAPVEQAAADYRASAGQLAPVADFLVVNVSSPNTPGLRDMQAAGPLTELVAELRGALQELDVSVPLLLKLAPDLGDDEIDDLADLALELELDGIVATNTTVDRNVLASPEAAADMRGGISGAPLKERALEVLRRLRARVGDRLVLISVGGIETPDDAWRRILAGATLVQAYTGFVYGGPLWPHRINRGLARRLRATGAPSLQAVVGSGQANAAARDGIDGAEHQRDCRGGQAQQPAVAL